MLWLRFWLETRLRVAFVVAWSAFFFLFGVYDAAREGSDTQVLRAFVGQTTFIALLAAGMLAGSGVRSPLGAGALPWAFLAGSVLVAAICGVAAVRVLQRQEY